MALKIQRFTGMVALRLLVNLRGTNANCAFNGHLVQLPRKKSIKVKGFIGVENSESKEIKGAFCYGPEENLVSVVFSMTVNENNFAFKFQELPEEWFDTDAEQFIKSILKSVTPKVDSRMYERMVTKKKSGGCYTGPRLEAHKRTTNLGRPQWQKAFPPFTEEFKRMAKKLNVTYK